MSKKSKSDGEKKLKGREYLKELRQLQAELCHLQEWIKHKGLRAIIVFEGRDAAGKTLAERDQLLQRTVTDNQRALALAQTSYRVGKIDLRTVQQQQLSVYAAQLTRLRVQSEQLAQRANLHLALGGSWTLPSTVQASR